MNKIKRLRARKTAISALLLASMLVSSVASTPMAVLAAGGQTMVNEHSVSGEQTNDSRESALTGSVLNGDFETGDMTGWTLLDGTAATNENNNVGVLSNVTTYWGSRNFYKQGTYFLSGSEKETKAGAIRSSSFTLSGEGYIAFLIGAANTKGKGCVKLYEEAGETDTLVKTYENGLWNDPVTGQTLLRIYDKLGAAYMGKELYFVVENGSEAGFSFINVDDFRTSMTKEQVQELYLEDVARVRNIEDEHAEAICELYRDVVFYGTQEAVGEGLATGEMTIEAQLPDSIDRQAGWNMNVEDTIRSATVVKDQFGIPGSCDVTVTSVTFGDQNVTASANALVLEEGTYTVDYKISYESKEKPVEVSKSLTIHVTKKYEVGPTIPNGDFETGDLTGWTLMDGSSATNANNSVGIVSDEDTYWGTRHMYQQGTYCLRGDSMEIRSGRIRSGSFILGGDGYISFLIGAAAAEGKGCVKLYQENGDSEDTLIATYTNKNWSDPKTGLTLLRVYDKLDAAYMGKELYFVVENGSEAGFSFINVDDFQTSLTKADVVALQNQQIEDIKDIKDEYKDYIISCYRKNGIINDIVLQQEMPSSIDKYAGLKVNLAEMIASATKVLKSYSLVRVTVDVKVDSVKHNGQNVQSDLAELMLEEGTYTVDYTLAYSDVTAKKSLTINVKEVDASIREVENGGFEDGDLTGWEVINEKVWNKSENGSFKGIVSAKTYWDEKLTYNQEGAYHLDGWDVTGDEAETWGVRSSVFTLAGGGWISARMGGNSAQLRVYKLDGTLIGMYNQNRFSDKNFPFIGEGGSWADMGTYFVDLHEYVGEPLYVELRDRSIAGGWAHAFFDDVKCYYETAPDVVDGYDTAVAPVGRAEDKSIIYGDVKIPWTQLAYNTDVLKLSFEDTGFVVANSWGSQQAPEIESVFKDPEYQDDPVDPYRPDGVEGKALNFDGYSNYASYNENVEGSKLTINAYVSPRAFMWDSPNSKHEDHIAEVIAGSYDEGAKKGFLLGVTKHGYLAFRVGTGENWYSISSEEGKTIPLYEWSRVTGVFDGDKGVMTIYLNGVAVGSMDIEKGSEIVSAGTPILIGKGSQKVIVADNLFDGTMFPGLIDELSISMKAMTAAEVAASGSTLPEISYEDAMAPDSALNGDYYRPTYHAVPAGNWMNEPHTLFQYKGKWHLFYQTNQGGPFWHNISWGHWVSTDMVNWKFVKEAVVPTDGTISPDGVWTGNVIFTSDGEPLLLITIGDDSRPVNGSNQHVGLVRADNYDDPELTDWTILGYAVAQTSEMGTAGEFRDAQAFGIGNDRYMVVGGADSGQGVAHVFKTTAKTLAQWEADCGDDVLNGMNWEYMGDLFGDFYDTNEYKADYGKVWEMPNIVPLQDEKGNATDKYLFVFSPQHGDNDVWYYIGEFDTQTCRFTPDYPEAKLMDYGNNIFTGPTVYQNPSDGKVYICSIMQENAAGQEPVRTVEDHRKAGWAFYAGLPRELYLQSDGKSLGIKNIDTWAAEGDTLVSFENLTAAEANEKLKSIDSDTIKIEFTFAGAASELGFNLKKSEQGATRLFLTDSQLGLDVASGAYKKGETVKGVVYVDKCSIEAYIDNSVTVSGSKYIRGTGLEVFIDGEAVCSMTVTEMNSIHKSESTGPVESKDYKICYVMNGGTNNAGNPASYSITSKTITLKAPTRKGYTFGGWYSDSKFKKRVKTIAYGSAENKTLYAKWTANTYTIKFNKNGGKTGTVAKMSSCEYGKSYKLRANKFKRSGYKFVGWNTKSNGKGKTYKNNASIKNLVWKKWGSITLYAQWKKIK